MIWRFRKTPEPIKRPPLTRITLWVPDPGRHPARAYIYRDFPCRAPWLPLYR